MEQIKEAEEGRKTVHEKLDGLKRKHRSLENRRKMDFEGFSRDISLLRQQVRNLEEQALGRSAPIKIDERQLPQDRKINLQNQVFDLRKKLVDLENEMKPINTTKVKKSRPKRLHSK